MKISIGEALRKAIHYLTQADVAEPRAAAEVLLADLLCLPRSHLYLDAHRPLSPEHQGFYAQRLRRRRRGEPVQYITGRQEFWSLDFEVNAQVLIPRPESELLVVHGARLVRQWCVARPLLLPVVLDVGTGSGNLAISLAWELPHSRVWGIDRAWGALQVARRNAQRLGVADRITWACSDLLTAFQADLRHFTLCMCNLPYVTTVEWQHLAPEIRDYEPPGALLGGRDGLDLIRRVLATSPGSLAPGGSLLLEVGWRHAAMVVNLMWQTGSFRQVEVVRDFAGIERLVWAQVP
ncbi:Release factor glutamine methyltransferase [Candidatus Entotheonellaceae bacterium PAL068K]